MLSSYTWSQDLLLSTSWKQSDTKSVTLSKKRQMRAFLNTLEVEDSPVFVKAIDSLFDQHIVPVYHDSSLTSNTDTPINVGKTMDTMWSALPTPMKLEAGGVPKKRLLRKSQQVANLYAYTERLIEEAILSKNGEINVVEFAAGSGHIILPLAYSYRNHKSIHFTCIDLKPEGIAIATDRVTQSKLKNITLICGLIEDYDKAFDIGLSLHACGNATDAVIHACLKANAAMVICACCIGKMDSNKTSLSKYLDADELNTLFLTNANKKKGIEPKSILFRDAIGGGDRNSSHMKSMWSSIVKAADFGHNEDFFFQETNKETNRLRRLAKSLIEYDRCQQIKEYGGYDVSLSVMSPRSASSKNDIIIAKPKREGEGTMLDNNRMVLDKDGLVDYLLYGGEGYRYM
jgi:hypothetical protein